MLESPDDIARRHGIDTPANRKADILLHAGPKGADFGDTLRAGTTPINEAITDKRFGEVSGEITSFLESTKDYLKGIQATNPDKELEIRVNDSIPVRLHQPEMSLSYSEISNDPQNPNKLVVIIGLVTPIKRDENGNQIR